MKRTSYFLIIPRSTLVERLQEARVRDLSDLSRSVMWSGGEHDRSLLQHSDVEELVKVLFLDVLLRERGSHAEFANLFPMLVRTAEYFDVLWMLERVDLDMSIEDAIEDALITGSLGALSSGNARINEFLAIVKSRSAANKVHQQ